MSLFTDAMEDCRIMDVHTESDGRGGFISTYTDGAEFKASISLDTSTEARIGEKAGVKNLYSVYTFKNVNLRPFQVFKRLSDGKVFRITSDGQDVKTPNRATLDMRKVAAEQYEIGA